MGVTLIVIAALTLLNTARGFVSYFPSADDGGIVPQISVLEFLLDAPEQTLVPAVVGILSAIAAVGVFRGRRWGQILAIGVGAASVLGGVMLLLPLIAEWGPPGSFAILLVPPGIVALLAGAFIVYTAVAYRTSLRG